MAQPPSESGSQPTGVTPALRAALPAVVPILFGLIWLMVFQFGATGYNVPEALAWMADLSAWNYAIAFIFIIAGLIVGIAIRATKNSQVHLQEHTPAPIGHTTDGQPIYLVVGYTPDGRPVTADRAVGLQPTASGTNGMAIAALVTGLTVAPLGIIFGHIALSQIKQTGQGGKGMAIAGLVLGYLSVAFFAIALIATVA